MSVFREAFDRLSQLWNSGNAASQESNLEGSSPLAWWESPALMSYLVMYRVTKEPNYLRALITQIDNVVQRRDDKTHIPDYRNIAAATWASRYSAYVQPNPVDGKFRPYAFQVHSGMAVYPMADFCQLVKNTPELQAITTAIGESFSHVTERILEEVEATFQAHEDQWDDNVG